MLDGAQRMIAELKADPNKKVKSGLDEIRSREVQLLSLQSISHSKTTTFFYS